MTSVCEPPPILTSDNPIPLPSSDSNENISLNEKTNDEKEEENDEKNSLIMVDVSTDPELIESSNINEEPIAIQPPQNFNRPKTVPAFAKSDKSPEHYYNGFSVCRRRVLKPPGGGSSDIFGQGPADNSPRRVRNYVNSSQLFGDNTDSSSNTTSSSNGSSPNSNGSSASNKPGNDSHERLFGPPPNRPASAIKDRLKSNIPIGGDADNNLNIMVNGHHQNGNNDHPDGNPVTGEGYPAVPQKSPPASANGDMNGRQAPLRNRVPPGGYSSGLW